MCMYSIYVHALNYVHLAENSTFKNKPEDNKCRLFKEGNMNNRCILEKPTVHKESSASTGIPFPSDTVYYTEDDLLGEERTQQSNTCHLENDVFSDGCETTEDFRVCHTCGILVADLNKHFDNEHARQIRKSNYMFSSCFMKFCFA